MRSTFSLSSLQATQWLTLRSSRVAYSGAHKKLHAEKLLGIRKLDFGPNGGRIVFRDKPEVDPMTIIKLVQRLPRVYKLEGQDKLRVTLELPGATERIRSAQDVLVALGARRPG